MTHTAPSSHTARQHGTTTHRTPLTHTTPCGSRQYTPPPPHFLYPVTQEEWEQCKRNGAPHTPPSHHSTRPPRQTEGGHQHQTEGQRHKTGGSPSQHPPFNHHATHHRTPHPTIHDGPATTTMRGRADRGYPTTRTPQEDTHHHTPHTRQRTVA